MQFYQFFASQVNDVLPWHGVGEKIRVAAWVTARVICFRVNRRISRIRIGRIC